VQCQWPRTFRGGGFLVHRSCRKHWPDSLENLASVFHIYTG
jgi:hypothetical protein